MAILSLNSRWSPYYPRSTSLNFSDRAKAGYIMRYKLAIRSNRSNHYIVCIMKRENLGPIEGQAV